MDYAFSFSTNAFTRHDLAEALEAIASAGFRGVEILGDAPHLYLADLEEGRLAEVAATLERLGLALANLNANTACGYFDPPPAEVTFEPSLINPEPALRGFRLRYTRSAMRAARALGGDTISITTGRALPGMRPERALAILEDALARIAEEAEEIGVRVGIEYEPGLLIERADHLLEMLERVGSDRIGANLDVGHAWVAGEDPAEVIRRLGPRLFHLHLEDIRDRRHYHLPPGEGDLDFAGVAAALAETGFRGFASWELYTCVDDPRGAVEAAARYGREAWPG